MRSRIVAKRIIIVPKATPNHAPASTALLR